MVTGNNKKEVRYAVDACSYLDRALAVRVGFVIHDGRTYPCLTCYRHHRYYLGFHPGPEIVLIAENLKGG